MGDWRSCNFPSTTTPPPFACMHTTCELGRVGTDQRDAARRKAQFAEGGRAGSSSAFYETDGAARRVAPSCIITYTPSAAGPGRHDDGHCEYSG